MGEKEKQKGSCAIERGTMEGMMVVRNKPHPGHGDIQIQAVAKDHVWVNGPTKTQLQPGPFGWPTLTSDLSMPCWRS